MWLLCGTLERAGPAFIKWGQWAATRPDMFPPDMCTELERLQTKAPAHSARFSIAAVEAAFGAPIDQMFDSFEEDPVASGSIAQVSPSASFSKIVKLTPESYTSYIHTLARRHCETPTNVSIFAHECERSGTFFSLQQSVMFA
jgi:hypothetical protein